jgi:CheY-like chemotaxis protein
MLTGTKNLYPVYSVARKEIQMPSKKKVQSLFEVLPFKAEKIALHPNRKKIEASSAGDYVNNQEQKRKNLTVMLVDDEPDIIAVFESFLSSEGYNAESFLNPYQALQSFADSEPDYYSLIVLDIRMPSMNGLQLYKRLKAIDPNVKIIFLSALEATDELVSVLEGVKSVDVMKKPIDREQFIQKIRSSSDNKIMAVCPITLYNFLIKISP